MNYVDILIIIFIAFGFLLGWSSGFIKKLVSTVGLILIIALSFIIKNPIASIFYKHLPFFEFKGNVALNIIVYEVVAFLLVFCVLNVIFRVLVLTSSLFEKILNATIILGIPSKILGGILGALEYFIISYFIIFFLNLPVFDMDAVNKSKFTNDILPNATILSDICDDSLELYSKISILRDEYKLDKDKNELNSRITNLLIEYKVLDKEEAKYLVSSGKLKGVTLEN